MQRSAKLYLDEAAEAVAADNVGYAVWLIENAVAIATSDADIKRISSVSETISDQKLSDVAKSSVQDIRYLDTLISDCRDLIAEEWMQVISQLSGVHSLARFVERTKRACDVPSLKDIMSKLSDATDQFTYPPFRRQLQAARQRNPNPLPPPLQSS